MTEQLCLLPFEDSMTDKCVDLFIDTFSKEPWNDIYDSREQVVDFFKNYINNNYFLGYVLVIENDVIALSIGSKKPWINGMEYYIDQFCVKENFQGKGIGSKFLKLIEADMNNKNVNGIILNTEKGFPSETFYLNNGFKPLDELIFLAK